MPTGKQNKHFVIVVYLKFCVVRAKSLYKKVLFHYFPDSSIFMLLLERERSVCDPPFYSCLTTVQTNSHLNYCIWLTGIQRPNSEKNDRK